MESKSNTPNDRNCTWTKADDNLMSAVAKKDLAKVRTLVRKKVNPTKISPNLGVAAIHQAACFETADILNALFLFPSIDVNKTDARKRTALHHAVREGRDSCVQCLIMNKTDTNLPENEGLTPMHLACSLGHLGCVQLLMSTVKSLDSRDEKGRTALFHAAARGSASTCRMLLEHGANVDAADKDGRTSIMVAAENGHQAAFQYLLSKHANVCLHDSQGRDVRWYATSANHADLLLLLTNSDEDDASSLSHEATRQNVPKTWGPEPDLSEADPQKMPHIRHSRSFTDSEHSSKTTEENCRSKPTKVLEDQPKEDEKHTRISSAEWTEERIELIQKLTELAEENKNLIDLKDQAEQKFSRIISSQKQIYPLMEDVYKSVETICQQSTMEEFDQTEVSNYLQETLQKLTLMQQFINEYDRQTKQGDGMVDLFVDELNKKDRIIRDLENNLENYRKQIEGLKTTVSQQSEFIKTQQEKTRDHEETLRQYKDRVQSQETKMRNFQNVKEAIVQVTALDDVTDELLADIIREISKEFQKLQMRNKELEATQASLSKLTEASEIYLRSFHDPSMQQLAVCNDDDWNYKTLTDLCASKSHNGTPIADLLSDHLLLLRESLEIQITIIGYSITGSFPRDSESAVVQQFDRQAKIPTNGQDKGNNEEIIRQANSLANVNTIYDCQPETNIGETSTTPKRATPSGGVRNNALEEDERMQYQAEIRQLRSKISSLCLRDSGIGTLVSDAGEEFLMPDSPEPFVPSEISGLLVENARLRSELELLRNNVRHEITDRSRVLSEAGRTDSKEVQTEVRRLLEAMAWNDSDDKELHGKRKSALQAEVGTSTSGKIYKTRNQGSMQSGHLDKVDGCGWKENQTKASNSERNKKEMTSEQDTDSSNESQKKDMHDSKERPVTSGVTQRKDLMATESAVQIESGRSGEILSCAGKAAQVKTMPNQSSKPFRPNSSSSEDDDFGKTFLVSRGTAEQWPDLKSSRKMKMASKIQQQSFDLQVGVKFEEELEAVTRENKRLKLEITQLNAKINELNCLKISTNVKTLNVLDDGQNNSRAQDSYDSYEFLSVDANGSLKFKEFPAEIETLEQEEEMISITENTTDLTSSSSALSDSSYQDNAYDSRVDRQEWERQKSGGKKTTQLRGRHKRGKIEKRKTKKMDFTPRGNEAMRLISSSSNRELSLKQKHQVQQQQQHPMLEIPSAKTTINENSKRFSIEVIGPSDANELTIFALRKQIQESESMYKSIIGTYRSHLLASIQGCLDNEVADALCRIITLQNGRA